MTYCVPHCARGFALSLSVLFAPTLWSATIYVSPTGTGDGSSWASPAPIETAVASAAAGDEVWLKEGSYAIDLESRFAVAVAISLRGGFAGTESAASERVAGARSVVHSGTNSLFTLTATSGTVVFDGLVISNAFARGVWKRGAASMIVKDCAFCDNGPHSANNGLGFYADQGGSATLAFENVEFLRNRTAAGHASAHPWSVVGYALYANGYKSVAMTNCLFKANGLVPSYHTGGPGRETQWASIAYFEATSVTASGCRFLDNRITCHSSSNDRGGRIVALNGNCSGSSFDHCLWAGNAAVPYSNALNIYGGMVYANLGAASQTVSLTGCTFAYNMAPTMSCAGLHVRQGKATVRDCIFYGNLMAANESWGKAADVYVSTSNASLDIDNTLLAGEGAPYLVGATGADMAIGAGMVYGDPLFATGLGVFSANVKGGTVKAPRVSAWNAYLADDLDSEAAFDFHVQSTAGRWNGSAWVQDASLSPAIDAADETADYSAEPAPNGARANLGYYGGTAEASKSSVAVPELASVTVSQGDDYTRPTFTIITAAGAAYTARITLFYTTDAPADATDSAGYDNSVIVNGAGGPGTTYAASTKQYFETGTTLYYLVMISNANGGDLRSGSLVLTGDTPPQWGKGGGAEVIHVWTGASGAGDGSSWIDAVSSLTAAADLVDVASGRTNIWIAGDLVLSSAVVDFPSAVSVRGGFSAVENTPGERADGSRSALDGLTVYRAMTLPATSGTTTLDRLRVARCLGPAVSKTGAGSLALVDCNFEGNGNATSCRGAAVRAVGTTAAATLFATNCTFAGNWCSAESVSGYMTTTRDHSGAGLYAESFRSAGLYDCAFTTNGPPVGNNSTAGRGGTFGGALMLSGAPATVERCRFVGNRTCSHADSNCGDSVWVEGNGDGTVFRNCAFVGNSSFYSAANSNAGRAAGVGVNLGNAGHTALFENCTFAWNVGHKGNGGAIDALKGAVRVVNSIFHGNSVNTSVKSYTGLDLYAYSTATIAVSHSMLASTNAPYCASETAGAITFGDGVVEGDPLFMTESVTVSNPTYAPSFSVNPWQMNIHLKSRIGYTDEATGEVVKSFETSPAIDAGAKGAQYAREPMPNGRRVNLGFYGNTPFASMSRDAGLVIVVR
ncbi:MAG: hypothetical protein IJ829_03540 [Kiritimatiellae bacterium]|nr:hypothetical protein [Kiritimatiellia bacterium]